MNTKSFFPVILMFSLFAKNTLAQNQTLSFAEVWKEIRSQSPSLSAAEAGIKAAQGAEERASRHWLPRLYLDAKSYQTNDPGNVFFGLMEQKALTAPDFNTSAINNPNSQTFTRAALGLDLPLYEGGMKNNNHKFSQSMESAQVLSGKQTEVDQYSQVANSYASIAIIKNQNQKLTELSAVLDRMTKTYQLGSKANPIGYSGLLGMKSLSNRTQGMIIALQARMDGHLALLSQMGLRQQNWQPQFQDAETFVNNHLAGTAPRQSYRTQSLKLQIDALESAAEMEKSRYLPRVGAFAESYQFNGSRDTAQGYTAGLYLQWSLFNPNDFGSYNEAKLRATSQAKQVEASVQMERAQFESLQQGLKAAQSNLKLLNESQKILTEQTQIAENLFKNGSINALQFVEVLNRRADLINAQTEAALQVVQLAADLARTHEFQIPIVMNEQNVVNSIALNHKEVSLGK